MTPTLPVWCVNTVLLSDSNSRDFALHNTQNFVYYTKRIPKSLSHSAVRTWLAGWFA